MHWCYAGVNIGSEEDGKGKKFTRPALILKTFGDCLVLVVFTTSQIKTGKYYYPLVIGGIEVCAILNQIRVVDRRRIRDYVDEITDDELKKIRLAVVNLIL